MEPPDPIPNSAVKRVIADGSVGLPHVRVGHRQALNVKRPDQLWSGRFFVHSFLCAGLCGAGSRSLMVSSLRRAVNELHRLYVFII